MDKMIKVTTIEQAHALPEVGSIFWEEWTETIQTGERTGETVMHRKAREFYPSPCDGDQIINFTDSDGRTKQVIYTKDGPAKARVMSWV